MKSKLIPDILLDSVYQLDIEMLRKRNINSIIVDIDNTLVAWETKFADEQVLALVKKLLDGNFKICILSNNSKKRVEEFNREMKLPAIYKAVKPRKKSFLKAMELMGSNPGNTAVIGDQLFTDILGGRRLGLFCILVTPISEKEFIGTRIVRMIEKRILKDIKARNL